MSERDTLHFAVTRLRRTTIVFIGRTGVPRLIERLLVTIIRNRRR